MRVDRAAAQAAGAADHEAVLGRLDVGAEAAQAVDDGGDAVGLLDPQLVRAPRTTVSPSAKQPSSATSGSSSIASGTSSALDHACRPAAPARDLEVGDRLAVGGCASAGSSSVADDDRRPCARGSAGSRIARPVDADVLDARAASRGRARRRRRGTRPRTGRRGRGCRSTLELVGVGDGDAARRRGGRVTPAAASIRSVWSRLGDGSMTVVAPSASSAGEQHARLHLRARRPAARSRCPCSARAADGERREAVLARVDLARPSARSGSAMRSTGRRRIDSSPSSVQTRRRPARRASRAAAASACRRCRRRSRPSARAPRAGRRRGRRARRRASSTSAPSARTASSVEFVSAASR